LPQINSGSSLFVNVSSDDQTTRDISIDDAKEIRNVLQPLAEDCLPAILGTSGSPGTSTSSANRTPFSGQQQQKASLSGIPIDVVGLYNYGFTTYIFKALT
jgi:hypothetical protein